MPSADMYHTQVVNYRIFTYDGALLGIIPLPRLPEYLDNELMLLKNVDSELTIQVPYSHGGSKHDFRPGIVAVRLELHRPTLVSPMGGELKLRHVAGDPQQLPGFSPSMSDSEEVTVLPGDDGDPQ